MEGMQVTGVENGLEARQWIEANEKPCIILLDLMMPVMDGRQFLRWKNNRVDLSDVPVVIISALSDETLQGVQAALKKPIDLDELFDVVDQICA